MSQQIKNIRIDDYDYPLDDYRIAKYPLEERDSSKLLFYHDRIINDYHFRDLPSLLPKDCVLVRNNTKVIKARLLFQKATGAQIEVFCLDPLDPNSYELSLSSKTGCTWHCLLGNAKRWKSGLLSKKIKIEEDEFELIADKQENDIVRFTWNNPNYSFSEILDYLGILPIPPYLHRDTEPSDLNTYQTVYACQQGSVAAPTAGLHFTDNVNNDITSRGIPIIDITLHVGAGTFKPVKSDCIGDHLMHSELIVVNRSTIAQLYNLSHRKIVAVGTTSVRTLESLYQLAVTLKSGNDPRPNHLVVKQWDAYEQCNTSIITPQEVFMLLLNYMDKNGLQQLVFPTEIMIAPGYTFGIVQGLITNFHQPHSTLLLLISAFTKGDWRHIYDHALSHNYRFLSYGDSSLLLPAT